MGFAYYRIGIASIFMLEETWCIKVLKKQVIGSLSRRSHFIVTLCMLGATILTRSSVMDDLKGNLQFKKLKFKLNYLWLVDMAPWLWYWIYGLDVSQQTSVFYF